ncbi:uncharacterized protein I206_107833 [Kwoniella pini CBS 10737]|uniref:Zn(2)-C6 fungal-type domain-containing protein n=1 Tax=Kwoniella pini CBS 10737 TaxID=1296096 RepID=A0AAJ8MS41_9TREE
MPREPPVCNESRSSTASSRKRRGLACERCRSRKQKCLPGQESRCRNCQRADERCETIERSSNEIHLER